MFGHTSQGIKNAVQDCTKLSAPSVCHRSNKCAGDHWRGEPRHKKLSNLSFAPSIRCIQLVHIWPLQPVCCYRQEPHQEDIETGSCQNLMELASHQLLVWFARLTSRSPATEAQRFPCKGHQTSTSSTPNPRLSLPWQNILENIPSHFQIKVWIQHKLRLLAYCPCVCQLKEMPVTQAPLPCTAFSPLPILFL